MKKQIGKIATIEDAAVEILTILGGKAHISEINPYIIEHVELTGKTPERSISCSLQRARKVRASKGQRGWWELMSYQEEIAKRDAEIAKLRKKNEVKDGLIVYMKSEVYQIVIISDLIKQYMNICKRKSQSAREIIQKSIADIATRLKFNYTDDTQEILNRFDDEKTPEITFIKKEYKDNATSVDIEIPGLTKQDLLELWSDQQQNLLGDNTQKQLEEVQ